MKKMKMDFGILGIGFGLGFEFLFGFGSESGLGCHVAPHGSSRLATNKLIG